MFASATVVVLALSFGALLSTHYVLALMLVSRRVARGFVLWTLWLPLAPWAPWLAFSAGFRWHAASWVGCLLLHGGCLALSYLGPWPAVG